MADDTQVGHGSGVRGEPAGTGATAARPANASAGTSVPLDDTLMPTATDSGPLAGRRDYPELTPVERSHYVIGDEIARGGMGRIFTARDRRLGRTVAIKELLVESEELRARFEREARITANLQHPAIVNILEAGTWPSGEPFYAMKLVKGDSLDKVIATKQTVAARLALIPAVITVVDALAYAHEQSVIHRDLKPANVLVGDFGETVVIDWGLAKSLLDTAGEPDVAVGPYRGGAAGATVAGAIMGTPAYMPPEQARGDALDAAADVYSLGALLYHVLVGGPPFAGVTATAILEAVLAGPPATIRAVDGVPPDLAAIVDKAMARDKADRYPTAGALAVELKKFQTGQLVGAQRYTTWMLMRRWLGRHRAILGVVAVASLALGGVGVWSFLRISDERAGALAARDRAEIERAAAETARKGAEQVTGRLLADKGRQEFLKHNGGGRALAYLLEANRLDSTPVTRLLLSEAARPYVEELAAYPVPRGSDYVPLRDGTRVLVMGDGATGSVLIDDSGRQIAKLEVAPDVVEVGSVVVGLRASRRDAPANDQPMLVVANTTTGAVAEYRLPMNERQFVRFDDDRVLVEADTGSLLVDVHTGAMKPEPALPEDGSIKAVSPDGRRLLIMWRTAACPPCTLYDAIVDRATGTKVGTTVEEMLSQPTPLGGVHVVEKSASLLTWTGTVVPVPLLVPQNRSTEKPSVFADGAVTPTTDGFAMLARDGAVEIVDASSTARMFDVGVDATRAKFCPDGRLLVPDAYGTTVWTATGDPIDRLDALGPTLCGKNGDITIIDTTSLRVRRFHLRPSRLQVVTGRDYCPHEDQSKDGPSPFDARGRAILRATNGAVLVDAAGTPRDLGSGFPGVRFVAQTDDGALAAIVEAGRVTIVDTATKAARGVAKVDCWTACGAAFTRGGRRLAITSLVDAVKRTGTVAVFDVATVKLERSIGFPAEPDSSFGISPLTGDATGALLVVPSMNGATIYDLATGTAQRELVYATAPGAGAGSPVYNAQFSPDGTRVVGVGANGLVLEWDAASGRELHRYAATTGDARYARYSRDGGLLVTSHEHGPTRIWNTRTGELVTVRDESSRGFSNDLSADGLLGATGATAESILWDARTGDRLLHIDTPLPDRSYAWPEASWFSLKGDALFGGSCGRHWVRALDLAPSASDIETATAHVPWKLVDGILVPRQVPAFGAAN